MARRSTVGGTTAVAPRQRRSRLAIVSIAGRTCGNSAQAIRQVLQILPTASRRHCFLPMTSRRLTPIFAGWRRTGLILRRCNASILMAAPVSPAVGEGAADTRWLITREEEA